MSTNNKYTIEELETALNNAKAGINVKENEQIVLSKKDSRLSYNFARSVPTADIKAHEKIVLENGRCDVSFSFGMTIPGADIQAHICLMNMSGKYGWELELKNKLKEINDKEFLEEQDKENLLSLKDDEETLKILKVVRMLEEEDGKKAILDIVKEDKEFITYSNIKSSSCASSNEECKTHIFKREGFEDIYINIEDFKMEDIAPYPINSKPIKETNWLKENAIEGIYQGISQTVVKNLAKSIIELLKLNKIDEPSIYLAEKFLNSPIGISVLLALVGAGIHFIPAKLTQDNIHIQKVGDKCIQSCTAIGSEHLINLATNMVLPAITNAISSNKQISVMEILEAKPNARVNVENDNDLDLYEKLANLASAN